MLFEPLDVPAVLDHVRELVNIHNIVQVSLLKLWQSFIWHGIPELVVWVHKWLGLWSWVNLGFWLWLDLHVESVDHLDSKVFLDNSRLSEKSTSHLGFLFNIRYLCSVFLKCPIAHITELSLFILKEYKSKSCLLVTMRSNESLQELLISKPTLD